eukprot:CAMPEP_0170582728 /NCGR_PEP_ID=MMETSP0224-20130122/7742_1 /TAXON_ID=285029 /ORGANISM="Togula jolla, Strain CCCM 725" /LENGTH=496 /DNA_ID=CAMNT_0010905979 /DNA_START=17 /DNA_END=1507 /DNA_ORIENTATION=-
MTRNSVRVPVEVVSCGHVRKPTDIAFGELSVKPVAISVPIEVIAASTPILCPAEVPPRRLPIPGMGPYTGGGCSHPRKAGVAVFSSGASPCRASKASAPGGSSQVSGRRDSAAHKTCAESWAASLPELLRQVDLLPLPEATLTRIVPGAEGQISSSVKLKTAALGPDEDRPPAPAQQTPRRATKSPPGCSELELNRLLEDVSRQLRALQSSQVLVAASNLPIRGLSLFAPFAGVGGKTVSSRDGGVAQLVEAIRKVTEILVWGESHDGSLFDLFCEHHMMATFVEALHRPSTPKAVRVQLLQSLAILVQNMRRSTSTYYLLSGGLLSSLFDDPPDLGDEETLAHFVGLLKSLALRVDRHSAQLCLAPPRGANRGGGLERIPIFERAVCLASQRDPMVRTAARAALLSLLRIGEPRLRAAAGVVCETLLAPDVSRQLREVFAVGVAEGAAETGEDITGFVGDLLALGIPSLEAALAQQLSNEEIVILSDILGPSRGD